MKYEYYKKNNVNDFYLILSEIECMSKLINNLKNYEIVMTDEYYYLNANIKMNGSFMNKELKEQKKLSKKTNN